MSPVSAGARELLLVRESLLAAERFRRQRGRWPESIEELTPAFLSEPLLDPFTGKPLIIRRTQDGIVIYSVSSDGRDDGGRLLPNYRLDGSDVGVRLWDPNKRRQPAKKDPLKDGP